MAFSAGAIVAKLELNKAKWSAAIKGVKGDIKTLGSRIQANSAQFKKYGRNMTIAGGAIVGAFGLMMSKYAKAGDEVHKMALRTGFATETLSELKYAAEISGGSLTSLEKGVKKMSKSLTDASIGLETYVRSFDRIGLSVEALMELSPEEQFMKIAEGIASLESPTLRAATAQEIFGRAGTELLPLFAEGVDGMEALRQKAKDLGYSFDQEAADGAARLVDAQTSLKTAVAGLGISISQNLAPALSDLIEGFSETVAKISDWIKEHPKLTAIITKALVGLGALLTIIGPIAMMLPGIVIALPKIAVGIKAMLGPVGLLVTALGFIAVRAKASGDAFSRMSKAVEMESVAAGKKVSWFKKTVYGLNAAWDKFATGIDHSKLAQAAMNKKIEEARENLKAYKPLVSGLVAGIKDWFGSLIPLKKGTEESGGALDEWGKLMKKHGVLTISEVTDKIKTLKEKQSDLKAAYDAGVIGLREYKKGTKEAKDEIKALKGITEKTTEVTETWKDYLQTLGIKTIPEKEKRVNLLKGHLEKLHQEYKDGKLDLEDYKKATDAVKGEMKELSTTITTTAMPAARDMTGVVEQAAGEIKGHIPGITETIETEAIKISQVWDSLTSNLAGAFGGFADSILTKGSDLGDAISGLWGDIKDSFKNMIASMVADWVKGMLVDIVGKTGQAAGGISSALSSVGSAVSGMATGIAGLITTLASAIATAATTLAAAAPALLIVLGIALAAFAGFKLISSLFKKKPKTGTMEAILGDIAYVFLQAICLKLDGVNDFLSAMFPKWDYTNSILAKIENICAKIRDNTKSIFSTLTKKGTIYVDVFRSAVIEKLNTGIKEPLKEISKAEAIKEKIAILDVSIDKAMKELQEKLKTAEGEERKKLEEAIVRIGLKAQVQRKEFLKQLEAVEKAEKDGITKTGGFFDNFSNKITGDLGKYISKTSEGKGEIPSAQFGAMLTQPGLVETHGTPSNPEIIMRQNDFVNLPLAKGKTEISLTQHIEFAFNNQVDPNFTRNHVRKVMIPAMLDGLQVGTQKTRLKEILGVA